VTILVATDLAKSFGAELVFSDVSFTIGRGDRVGVVGPNGSGKTTLLEIAAGRLLPDGGRIRLVGRPRLGYLEQEVKAFAGEGLSLFSHALEALSGLARREERLREIETEMATQGPDSPDLPELMEEYGALREAFEREGGYVKEVRIKEVLFGLGFSEEHFGLPLSKLSGGQRTRAHLARLLLEEPDLLLLDEPTNHLDLEAVEWLEGFLATFPGSVVAVSHDRYFLDHAVRRILEFEHHRLTAWTGNYTAYAAQKEAHLTHAREAYDRQREEIARLEDYVRRYMAGNRSTMAKSRLKAIGRIERLEKPVGSEPQAAIRFAPTQVTGREVLKLHGVGLAFSDGATGVDADGPGGALLRWLFRDITALVWRGQRVSLVGRNGVGKSTLLEVIVGRRRPTAGEAVWGAGVKPAYFSQGLDDLDNESTVLDQIMEATGYDIPHARSYLGRFLFSGEDVYKQVSALSGGERSRLVLACLVASQPNVLVLDEPTNHLDLPAREGLEQAIRDFPGTVVFVSHDRYFIERLATRVWELDAGALVDFAGSYRDYRLWQAQERLRKAGPAASSGDRPSPPPKADRASGTPGLSKGRRAQLEKQLQDTQERIGRLERRRGELETLMAAPSSYREGAGATLSAEYRGVLEAIEGALGEWEKLATSLEGSS
jgi:ATP-binding cassette subfamily F protein 3